MRFWLERRYADWVIDSIRSTPVATRSNSLTYPPALAHLVLVLLFFGLSVIVVGYPYTADAAGLLVVLGAASIVLVAWRIVGECLPGSSVLRCMIVTGGDSAEVPRSSSERAGVVETEWERRVGATAARSMTVTRRRSRRGLVVFLVGVSLVQVMTVLKLRRTRLGHRPAHTAGAPRLRRRHGVGDAQLAGCRRPAPARPRGGVRS